MWPIFFLGAPRNSLPGSYHYLNLDIAGIIAILGDGGVTRNAQVSSLSWFNNLPRLLPAPQALLKQERDYRLPSKPGTVVGVYSGNVRHELNFFTSMLHPSRLRDFEVELVKVEPKDNLSSELAHSSYGAKPWGELCAISIIGCAMTVALIAVSVVYEDGMSLIATVLLSMVSSLVGISSKWTLVFPAVQPKRKDSELPDGDVVIYYPNGAFRIIRCKEAISRLYFQMENCRYFIPDTPYRSVALFATVMLILGIIFLSNATLRLQVAIASAYIILNVLYWGISAVDPTKHWQHAYKVTKIEVKLNGKSITATTNIREDSLWQRIRHSRPFQGFAHTLQVEAWYEMSDMLDVERPKKTFTSALWTAIALTGTSRWLNLATHIAPVSDAWEQWLGEAEEHASQQLRRADRFYHDGALHHPSNQHHPIPHPVTIPGSWDYAGRLTEILKEKRSKGQRPDLGDANPQSASQPV